MEGTIQSQNRSILLGSHWKKIERLKDSAIGNSINHYSDDEVYFNLLLKNLFILPHVCTQLDSLVKQLIDLVTSCSDNADENLEFRLAHDILFREVK